MAQVSDRKAGGQEAAHSSLPACPTLAELTAGFQAWLKAAGHDPAVNPALTWETPDGRPALLPLLFTVSAVSALPPVCRELAEAILDVLTDAGPGVMVKGADLAARISNETDHTAGPWGRAIKALKADGLIASNTVGSAGYCLIAAR